MRDTTKAIERIRIEICKLWKAIADINKHQSQVEPHAEPKPEPDKEQFEVDDWVEFIDVGGRESQGKCLSNADDRHYAILVLDTSNMRVVVPTTKIIRKLSHSEVVVRITISGTVRPAYNEDGTIDDEQFQLLPNGSWDGTEMFISFDALDNETRELVESLLKAQEQNNG